MLLKQCLRLKVLSLFECESFGTTATEYGCPLITAVRVHCKLSLALLLQSMLALGGFLLFLSVRALEPLLQSIETIATEHGCRLITAVSLHCKLSFAL